jgi:CheY-like chemotaxis protein
VAGPSFNELFGELRAEYLRSAPQRLEAMRRALDTLSEDAANVDALAHLRLTFHAWAGNGKTYGFPEVTRLGLEGDVQCATRLREGPPRAAEILGWRALAEAISRELLTPTAAPPIRAAQDAVPPRAGRVFCVDDDPHQCAFLRAVLSSAGYEVRACAEPARFLEAQSDFGPDLVLMDVVLPGTSGYELARLLHARTPGVPILFLTTSRDPGDSPVAPSEEVLRKPVEPAALLAAVRRRLAVSLPLRPP